MARPFEQLPNFMDKVGRDVSRGASRLVQDVALAIGATVVDTTRVDTGNARSNWRATLNAPASGVIPPYSPGNRLGFSETANANAAKAQQKQTITGFNVSKHRAVFITNNVHYIGILNDVRGDLMVEQGLQSGRLVLKASKLLSKK